MRWPVEFMNGPHVGQNMLIDVRPDMNYKLRMPIRDPLPLQSFARIDFLRKILSPAMFPVARSVDYQLEPVTDENGVLKGFHAILTS